MDQKVNDDIDIKNDRLCGLAEIAEFAGFKRGKTHFMLKKGALPGRIIGGVWYSSRSAIREVFTFTGK